MMPTLPLWAEWLSSPAVLYVGIVVALVFLVFLVVGGGTRANGRTQDAAVHASRTGRRDEQHNPWQSLSPSQRQWLRQRSEEMQARRREEWLDKPTDGRGRS